jgi:V/A-type H+/Na+-transporting ATPase subunit I
VYFVVITHPEEVLPEWEADEIRLPGLSLSDVEVQMNELIARQNHLVKQLEGYVLDGVPILESYQAELKETLAVQTTQLHTSSEVDGNVMLLEGWVPDTKQEGLLKWLDGSSVYYVREKCKEGEKPPVLLKNNAFNRLFEMIGNLYSLPNYGELDLTPFLAPFYLLFFGFCFSDAGYGLLFLGAATIIKMRSKEPSSVLSLVQLLGASTILFGILGGTVFGIDLYKTNLPVYSSLAVMLKQSDITIQDIMFGASLGLGFVQILLGMFIRATKLIKQKGFLFAVSTLSWAFLIITFAINYYLKTKGEVQLMNPPFIVLGSVFAIGILFMNSPGKNLLVNFGSGLWDAYNTVVGGIGDLLSYVRLFALGLASGILGLVFNELGVKLLNPDGGLIMQVAGYFFMTLVLIVGHAINIFMSGLGSAVHPLRLTFVEFYKNAGFEGGGRPYNPFRKQTI